MADRWHEDEQLHKIITNLDSIFSRFSHNTLSATKAIQTRQNDICKRRNGLPSSLSIVACACSNALPYREIRAHSKRTCSMQA
jgi:hypothetical protein